MRLLFVDNDPQSARRLHSEFLDYRGLNWSLTHCRDHQSAIKQMESDNFQCLLLRTSAKIDAAGFELGELVTAANCPPVLTVSDNLTSIEQLQLMLDGSDDCLNRSETNGAGIMRHLRMVELRATIWNQQASELAATAWEDAAALLTDDSAPEFASSLSMNSAAGVLCKTLRVAHVCYGTTLANVTVAAQPDLQFTRFATLDALIEKLEENIACFDAIVVEQSVFEEASVSALNKLKQYLPLISSVVLTLEKSDFSALSYLERGFSDCVTADSAASTSLLTAIRKSVVRRRRALLRSLSEQQVGPNVSDRRASVRNAQNRRRHVRFFTERSLIAIPVLPNGAPDIAGRCNATSIDVSLGGIGVKIPDREQLPSRDWIIGLEQADGAIGYVNAYLRRVTYQAGELNVGLIFQADNDDLFAPKNLWPSINIDSKRFETSIAASSLDQWVELGVLRKQLVRRTRTCPDCEAVCSVGTGCSQCGDFDLRFRDLIHHFACAHVNEAQRFEKPDSIQCPKCLRDNLVAGADFEMIRSQYTCGHCDYAGEATVQVGCCLNCQLRFPLEMGKEVDIHGYLVERMDILALVDSAR